ncbi:MAG: hypothetical protein CML50_19045 [Rhodobacteraceae bacterium]|uniref:Uncharacterized protein n=1 Tax=Salipiger profundus TaxID=1229727 RepID=A0A1U7D1D1_9RHOB|nr:MULTISPECIES: hypothetical protein [Salipiger]APX21918.1 hypothetical protein Ga0080559_TMP1122 [Salipiger profundus]MAB08096.1 hypothetical protein [Paracoccaceae bacterium]GGA06217.1 hypothetical protein GCM10011326_17390 [Salipiger profundus]SFC37061.1 hypothetical protein SAMN05444415_103108 [Salipiger profundus]
MLGAVGLLIVFTALVIFNMKNKGRRQCRWREYRHAEGTRYTCVQCGAVVEGERGSPPRICMRGSSKSA